MVKRSLRILWEVLGAVLAVSVIAVGALVWRATQGPVPLDFLTPYLTEQLDELNPQIDVALGGTVLTWQGWPETFALRVTQVRLTDKDGHTAEIPEVDLRLSVVALLHGTIAPTHVTTRGADLTLVRGPSSLRFVPPAAGVDADSDGAGEGAATAVPQRDISRLLPRILDDLMAAPSPDAWLSYLTELRIRNMGVRVHDTHLGITWNAPQAAVTIRRSDTGLTGNADLELALGDAQVPATLSLSYLRGEDSFVAAGTVEALVPAQVADAVPALAPAAGIEAPVTANLVGRIGLDGGLRRATAHLHADAGRVALPELFPEPLAIRDAAVRLEFDRAAQTLEARDMRLALGTPAEPGPTITGAARAEREADTGTISVTADAEVADLAANALPQYWPPGIQESGIAREWVTTNVRDGTLEQAEISAALTLPGGDPAKVTLDSLDGTMRYNGMRVSYLPGPRPVRDVAGTATFDKSTLTLDIDTGRLRGVRVRDGTVEVSGLDTTDQFLAIDLNTRGPLADSLAPLAHPQIDLLSELGIAPEQTGGTAEVAMSFAFPLLKDLSMEKVDLQTTAELRETAVRNFFLGQDATDGTLSLDINRQRMKLRGPLTFAGLPVEMAWTERFDDNAQPQRNIHATVQRLTGADLGRLWRDPSPYFGGTASLNLHWRGDGEGTGELDTAANLRDTRLAVPQLGWRKPEGVRGQATARLSVEQESPRRLHDLNLIAGGNGTPRLELSGSADLHGPGGLPGKARIANLRLGDTRLRDVAMRADRAGWRIDVGGGHLDAAPFLTGTSNENGAAKALGGRAFTLTTRTPLDYVEFGKDRRLNDVRLTVKRDANGRWQQIQGNANVPERFLRGRSDDSGSNIDVNYAPGEDGRHRLRARAANAGAALRALGILNSIAGGQLRVDGTRQSTDPDSPLEARVDLRSFKLRNPPVLSKIVSVALLTGIEDVLTGEGLSFQRLKGDLVLDDGQLRTDLLHAYGPAIGITAKGRVDLDAETLDVRGVLVPAALVNRVLGAIPLLGPIITGGEGQGLFSVMYRAQGDLADPDVTVNPLSLLAPGFLRNLFGAAEGEGEGEPRKAVPDDIPAPRRR